MSARSRSTRSDPCRRLRAAQLEEQIVRKRQLEFERQNFWNNNSTYFRTWDFNTALYSSWATDSSEECSKKVKSAKKKKELLEDRRRKLKNLLETENKQFEEELKNKKKPLLLEDLNAANMELLLREEDARRKERDLKMYHYWRQNQPSIRDFERKQHSDYVKQSWLHQVVEKRKQKEEEEKKVQEYMQELKRMQDEREQKEKELIEEKKKTEEELKRFLEKQMALVKCKEEQEKILKAEEVEVIKVQNELDKLIDEQKRLHERRKNIDLCLFHKRQYQLLLKKRAKEIQENLEADRIFLEKIAEEKIYQSRLDAERLEQCKKDLELAKKMCEKQAEIENIRRSQAEYLFDEEAKKMYEKQEMLWEKESEARKKIMNDVLSTLQVQIKEKLLENLKHQEETRRVREEILKNLEKANKELEEYQEKAKKALQSWKKDLDQQILEKKLEAYYKKKKQEEDKENELKAKREEEEKLCKELSKMFLSGYQPKVASRRCTPMHQRNQVI